MKKGPHTKSDTPKGGLHGGLINLETKSIHIKWSEHNIPNQKPLGEEGGGSGGNVLVL